MATRLGEKLFALRKEQKLTLERLAELSGLSKSYIWELENRESNRPSAEKLAALAGVLGIAPTYFLEEDVREPEERHLDEGFYREYQKLGPKEKETLRNFVEALKKAHGK